jgi:serine/threonine protein kinase
VGDRQQFIREVEILVKLRHPCVIQILGWSPGDYQTIEIQMQFAPNGSLSNHLTQPESEQRRSFGNPTRKAQLICDIVLGMRYVHSHQIIHRDLKPANILLDENWRGLIGDFGLSRMISGKGPPTPETGTRYYAAPEQWIPGVEYSEKVDVFAFGLILYEIISDVLVFPNGQWSRKLPKMSAEFGPVMHSLLPRCWSADANERPSFQEILELFASCGFGILPGVDRAAISRAVSEVLEVERGLGPGFVEHRLTDTADAFHSIKEPSCAEVGS